MKSLIIKFKETQDNTEEGVRFAGDGRFDSPGWSAKFCSYFVQVRTLPLFVKYTYQSILGSCFEKSYCLDGCLQEPSKC